MTSRKDVECTLFISLCYAVQLLQLSVSIYNKRFIWYARHFSIFTAIAFSSVTILEKLVHLRRFDIQHRRSAVIASIHHVIIANKPYVFLDNSLPYCF